MLGKNLPSIFQVHTSLSGHGTKFQWNGIQRSHTVKIMAKSFIEQPRDEIYAWSPPPGRWSQILPPGFHTPWQFSTEWDQMTRGALLLNETEYSKGLIATRQNQKTHRDLSMTRITIHQNPTVWHKFAQPTHLAPKKKTVFLGQATIASFPAFEAKKWPHTVGKSPNLVPWPQLFRLRSLRSPALNDRAKRCRKTCTGCIRLLINSPTFHLPHKFSYISYINLGGAYDAPPILSNSGKWRVNGISYLKCNNPRGHCYILYATLQCHLTSQDSAPKKNGSSEKWTWDGATVWLVFLFHS